MAIEREVLAGERSAGVGGLWCEVSSLEAETYEEGGVDLVV